jgi:hypothetical protein
VSLIFSRYSIRDSLRSLEFRAYRVYSSKTCSVHLFYFYFIAGLLLSIRPRKSNTAGFADVTISGLGFSREGMRCNFNGTTQYLSAALKSEDSDSRVASALSLFRCIPPRWGNSNLPPYAAHGLVATYYASDNLSLPKSSRIKSNVDFSVGYGLQQIGSLPFSEYVSIRWAGFLQPQVSQTYTFYAGVSDIDERARVWVDHTLVVDMWASLAGTEGSGTIGLWMAQEYYDIIIEYKQGTGSMGLGWKWESLTFPKQLVRSDLLLPLSDWGHSYMHVVPENRGLFATYYSSNNFLQPSLSYISDGIEFDNQQKALSLADENIFSVRWAGFLKPQTAETYTLFAAVSGGQERIRLWVDNTLIVDMWASMTATESSGTIVFGVENGLYDIKLEYKQEGSTVAAIMRWESTSILKKVISASDLCLNSDNLAPQVVGGTGFTFSGMVTGTPRVLIFRLCILTCFRLLLTILWILYRSPCSMCTNLS